MVAGPWSMGSAPRQWHHATHHLATKSIRSRRQAVQLTRRCDEGHEPYRLFGGWRDARRSQQPLAIIRDDREFVLSIIGEVFHAKSSHELESAQCGGTGRADDSFFKLHELIKWSTVDRWDLDANDGWRQMDVIDIKPLQSREESRTLLQRYRA
jgi:hypothetical protein